jgi:hypothetical protein
MVADDYRVHGLEIVLARLFLAAVVLMSVGCGRTPLLSSAGQSDGPPAGTDGGGPNDAPAADAPNAPDGGVGRGPDVSVEDRPALATDGGADSRLDMARVGDAGAMDAGTTDGRLDARIDGGPADLGDARNASDGGPPRLRLLAGVLGGPGAQDGEGSAAQFYFPSGVASDGAGNLFVADSANNTIRKIVVATRTTTTLAGSVGVSGSADGIGAAAQFYSPQGLACDGAGNLFVVDSANNTIRKVVIATGVVTTFAGSAVTAGSDDGTGTTARLNYPHGVASDGAGNLFVTDSGNDTIRKIVIATGKVTTLAGTAGAAGGSDGTGATARFNFPQGVTSDGAGNLYVTDSGNNTIRKVVIGTGKVTTLAGSATAAGSDDGTGTNARFDSPLGVTSDGAGNLYVADSGNSEIRRIVIATGAVTTLTGSAGLMGSSDGTPAEALFNGPGDVANDGAGSLIVADTNNHAIRTVDIASGAVTTLAGSASSAGRDDGTATTARFQAPIGVASDGAGNLLVADSGNHAIRKIVLATQTVSTLAGFAGKAGSADGTGAAALFDDPQGVASDGAGNLFVADSGNHTIRKVVVATGVVTTLAGDPTTSGRDDGTGASRTVQYACCCGERRRGQPVCRRLRQPYHSQNRHCRRDRHHPRGLCGHRGQRRRNRRHRPIRQPHWAGGRRRRQPLRGRHRQPDDSKAGHRNGRRQHARRLCWDRGLRRRYRSIRAFRHPRRPCLRQRRESLRGRLGQEHNSQNPRRHPTRDHSRRHPWTLGDHLGTSARGDSFPHRSRILAHGRARPHRPDRERCARGPVLTPSPLPPGPCPKFRISPDR